MHNDLSTFSSHIYKISNFLDKKHENSLILLDELGTGTEPETGAALSQAILEELLLKKCTVLATTHLNALKLWANATDNVVNGGMVFDQKKLEPTFELMIGIPSPSYALEIAKRLGIKNNIIKQSNLLLGKVAVNIENILHKLKKEKLITKELSRKLIKKEQIFKEKEKEIALKEKEIDNIFISAKSEANDKAQEIIINARSKVENIIEELRQSKANKKTIQKTKKAGQDTKPQKPP